MPATSTRHIVRSMMPVAVIAAALLGGCSSSPEIVTAWQDPQWTGPPLQKILVVGQTPQAGQRRIFEDVFVAGLTEHGVTARASHEFFPGTERPTREDFLATVEEGGFDAVLVSQIVGVDQKTTYAPGYTMVEPGLVYHNDFWGFYHRAYTIHSVPDYYDTYEVVSIETNVYEMQDRSLVWSGTTRSIAPQDVHRESEGLAEVIIRELATRGLVPAE